MKKSKLVLFLLALNFTNVNAVELICRDNNPQNKQKDLEDTIIKRMRGILKVDCTDRVEVVNVLREAYTVLQDSGIGGDIAFNCVKARDNVESLHPSISVSKVARKSLAACNEGLKYIKYGNPELANNVENEFNNKRPTSSIQPTEPKWQQKPLLVRLDENNPKIMYINGVQITDEEGYQLHGDRYINDIKDTARRMSAPDPTENIPKKPGKDYQF